jgi:hypothetical protein
MGSRGDLLALVDGAPGHLATLQGALTTWTQRELAATVHERAIELTGARPDELAEVAPLPPTAWDPDEGRGEAPGRGEHQGERGEEAGTAPGPAGPWTLRREVVDDESETLVATYVAVALPDRWRVVGRGHVAVSDGRRSWAGTSTLVTERDSVRAAIHDAGAIGACLYPGALLGGLELGDPDRDELEGRSCWVVDAHPRPAVSGTSLASSGAPHAVRLHPDIVGIDHRMWFDSTTGILLRHEGAVDGELCSWTSLSDLVFDAPLGAEEFRPPPGAVVRSRHELLRDHLADLGVDPDTVDLDDPVQVRDALRQGG